MIRTALFQGELWKSCFKIKIHGCVSSLEQQPIVRSELQGTWLRIGMKGWKKAWSWWRSRMKSLVQCMNGKKSPAVLFAVPSCRGQLQFLYPTRNGAGSFRRSLDGHSWVAHLNKLLYHIRILTCNFSGTRSSQCWATESTNTWSSILISCGVVPSMYLESCIGSLAKTLGNGVRRQKLRRDLTRRDMRCDRQEGAWRQLVCN